MCRATLRTRGIITLIPYLARPSAIDLSILITSKSAFALGRSGPYHHQISLTSVKTIVTLVAASSILPPLFNSLETISQPRVRLQFMSESLDLPQLALPRVYCVPLANQTMEEFKIQLPASMVKVNKSITTLVHAPFVLDIGQCVQANNQPSSQTLLREMNKTSSL